MVVRPLSQIIRGISGHTKSATSIVVVIIVGILFTVESAYGIIPQPTDVTASELSQCIKQTVKELEYSDEAAENFANMVNTWQDKQATPILVTLKQLLYQAKKNYTQGKISKEQLAETECSIAIELTHRIRKEITVNDNFFDLTDVIKHKQTQCVGYSQLFYILGTSVSLSVKPINVLELQAAGPLPLGFGHIACIVDLADGKTIMINLVPGGLISRPFILGENFTETGNYWELKEKTNPLNIYRKIQLLDTKGLIAYKYNNRGVNYISSGKLDEAASDCDRAINLNPNFATAWNNRANVYAKSGQFDKAISDYNRAIGLNSKLTEAYYNRGTIYDILKQYEQAVSDFSHAINLNSNLPKAYYYRGNAYAKLKQFDKAISDYNRTIELEPNFAKAQNNRKIAYALSGKSEGAKTEDLN
jgi:tetratricopeptide (TPR) repeat protein